jgi:hypothetical protein
MNPLTVFEQNFRAPEALLKTYRLFQQKEGAPSELQQLLRKHLSVPLGEETFLLSNEALHGLVRELAGVAPGFFRDRNLALLLRQAIVAACSAADVYYNSALGTYAVEVLLSRKQQAPKELREVKMTLGDYIGIAEYQDPKIKLKQVIAAQFTRDTLANVDGITVALQILGVGRTPEEVWRGLGEVAGHNFKDLREQVKDLVSRRNDIVHRGDRPRLGEESEEPQPIEYTWAIGHVGTLKKVVLASDVLIQKELSTPVEAGVVNG